MGWLDEMVTDRYAQVVRTAYPGSTPSMPGTSATYQPAMQWPAAGIPQRAPASQMPGFYLGNTFIPIWIPLAALGLILILKKK